jgi:hypothetical protein
VLVLDGLFLHRRWWDLYFADAEPLRHATLVVPW